MLLLVSLVVLVLLTTCKGAGRPSAIWKDSAAPLQAVGLLMGGICCYYLRDCDLKDTCKDMSCSMSILLQHWPSFPFCSGSDEQFRLNRCCSPVQSVNTVTQAMSTETITPAIVSPAKSSEVMFIPNTSG